MVCKASLISLLAESIVTINRTTPADDGINEAKKNYPLRPPRWVQLISECCNSSRRKCHTHIYWAIGIIFTRPNWFCHPMALFTSFESVIALTNSSMMLYLQLLIEIALVSEIPSTTLVFIGVLLPLTFIPHSSPIHKISDMLAFTLTRTFAITALLAGGTLYASL